MIGSAATMNASDLKGMNEHGPGRWIGLASVAVVPAGFWGLMLWIAKSLFGFDLSGQAILMITSAIALFLATVFMAIISGSDKSD